MPEYFARIEKEELHLIPRSLFRETSATLFLGDSGLKICATSKYVKQQVIAMLKKVIPDIEGRFEEKIK